MKPYFLLLCIILCSCQQVQREQWNAAKSAPEEEDTIKMPDIGLLRRHLFQYFISHRHESVFDTTDETYRSWGGPVNYPPYLVTAGHLFREDQVHAMIFYSDELGAGLFIYRKQDNEWTKIFEDTSELLSAGPVAPGFKDWNGDGIKDLCIYYPPALSISVIGHYALWLMDTNGSKLHYIKAFNEIENPEPGTQAGKVNGSYYYHGERRSEWKFKGYELVKVSEHRDRQG